MQDVACLTHNMGSVAGRWWRLRCVVNVGGTGTLSVRVSGAVVNVSGVEARWVQVPTPTPTLPPGVACVVVLDETKVGYSSLEQAIQYGGTLPPGGGWSFMPAGDTPIYVIKRSGIFANAFYPPINNYVWFNSIGNVRRLYGDCDNLPEFIPSATPYPTGFTPTPLPAASLSLNCDPETQTMLTNGITIDAVDCGWGKVTLNSLATSTLFTDQAAIADILTYIRTPVSSTNYIQLEARVEYYFCVDIDYSIDAIPLQYQRLVNTTLGLLQTANAFQKAAPNSFATLRLAACEVFSDATRRLTFQRTNTAQQGGQTLLNVIQLYNNGGAAHSAQNIVHEIGHFINWRLGGGLAAPGPSLSSPLGQLDAGNLRNANNGVISGVVNGIWNRGPGLGSAGQGWQQNQGGFCADNSCRANEEVADMILNWIYDKVSPVFVDDSANTDLAGSSRRSFLDTKMAAGWIAMLITTEMPTI